MRGKIIAANMSKNLRQYSKLSSYRKEYSDENLKSTRNNSTVADVEGELEEILSSIIDENYIVSVTGVKDLSRVEYVSLVIDSSVQSLLDLPDLLPHLKHLVLDNSQISSIRDLGVGLRSITSLSLAGCNLNDIDGISVLNELQELNLTDNFITDISPLTLHESLEVRTCF